MKAFFLGIDILHVCGPVARHLFRSKFQYAVHDEEISRNHARHRSCLFRRPNMVRALAAARLDGHLTRQPFVGLEAPDVIAEHNDFIKLKRRADREFWLGLLRRRNRTTSVVRAVIATRSALAGIEP